MPSKDTLRTLKDLYEADCMDYPPAILVEELKQEAIKWVKNCKMCSTAQPIPICSEHRELAKFNNIIEEDLLTNNELNAREHGEIGNN